MIQTRHDIGQASGLLVAVALLLPWAALAQQPAAPSSAAPPAASDQTLELAKKTQNPISDLISLPLQDNLNFGYGAKDASRSSSCSRNDQIAERRATA